MEVARVLASSTALSNTGFATSATCHRFHARFGKVIVWQAHRQVWEERCKSCLQVVWGGWQESRQQLHHLFKCSFERKLDVVTTLLMKMIYSVNVCGKWADSVKIMQTTIYETNFEHLLDGQGVSSSNKVGEGFAGKHRVHRVIRLHRLEHQINNLWKWWAEESSFSPVL